MNPIYVQSSSHTYPIYIVENIRHHIAQFIKKDYSSIMIITDENVASRYLKDVKKTLVNTKVHETIIPSGEQAKQVQTFYDVHTQAIKAGLDRQSLIIALGGGVVGDLAGFVAATFMRGIDYIQVPTTILAHDSSVGGKVAINHELGKNLIGNFHAPVAVIYDIQTLQTLPFSEVRSGYAEIIKEAMIADHALFDQLLDIDLQSLTNDQLYNHLSAGITVKKEIVIKDEQESNERMYLNLGHTLGHALESMYKYQTLLHGEAVAIGLLFAVFVSERHFNTELPFKQLFNWFKTNEFPLQVNNIDHQSLVRYMKTDKKATGGDINLILLKEIGQPVIQSFTSEQMAEYVKGFLEELHRLVIKG